MKKTILLTTILAAVVISNTALGAEEAANQITPPSTAIYLPSGASIVTDINVSDDNVLGVVKSATSALLDDLQDVNIAALCPMPLPASVSAANIKKLVESTYGITGIRVLAAQYKTSPQQFVKEFEVGIPKAGNFSRILLDTSNGDVALLAYAQPNNAGYMVAAYDPRARMIYAARLVGFINEGQLMDVVGDLAKAYFTIMYAPHPVQTAPSPTSEAQE